MSKTFELMSNISDYLISERMNDLRSLPRIIKENLSFQKGSISSQDLFKILAEMDLELEEVEKKKITVEYGNEGRIDFSKFWTGLLPYPSSRRQSFIDKAFLKFDHNGLGEIQVKDVKNLINVDIHPLVKNGVLDKHNVIAEFLNNFPNWKEGVIIREDWNRYYSAVSSSIDSDDHFVQLMKTTWRL